MGLSDQEQTAVFFGMFVLWLVLWLVLLFLSEISVGSIYRGL